MATASASSKTSTPKEALSRDTYGALNIAAYLSKEQLDNVKKLLSKASCQPGGLPKEYAQGSRTEFECMNHDIYDVQIIRGKVRGLVVQARYFWKHLRKTRTRITKTYYLITANRNKVIVTELENATCAKRAKNTVKLGQLCGHYLGISTVKCASISGAILSAFKVLAKEENGTLVSVFDGSRYEAGSWRIEAAKHNHEGGYYCYFGRELAIEATKNGNTFHQSVSAGKTLVLCEVEIAGKQIAYAGGKVAVSRIRFIREIEPVSVA
jgi:hypothetical protein